jgi:glycosyltransferase involved in cell wall biosynthesis
MRLLIIEPESHGHRGHYLRWLVQAAHRKQWDVVIATTKNASSHPILSKLSSEFENADTHFMQDSARRQDVHPQFWQLVRNDIASWRSFKQTVDEIRAKGSIDAIVLPYAEYCFFSLSIFGDPFRGIPWCAISMRLSLAQIDSTVNSAMPRKWRFAARILRRSNLRALFVINPSVSDVPQAWYSPSMRARLRYLPDPGEDSGVVSRQEARISLNLADGAVAILVYGWIDGRKGADALVRTLAREPKLDEYVVILAGEQSASMSDLLRSEPFAQFQQQKRLIVLNRFISDTEQSALFAAADIAWLGYRGHLFMSGVLVLAGRAGLPVIGTRDGEIGRLVETHQLGAVAAIEQPSDIARALWRLRDATMRHEMGQRARSVFAAHSVENFGDTVLAAFDS